VEKPPVKKQASHGCVRYMGRGLLRLAKKKGETEAGRENICLRVGKKGKKEELKWV
jgi:hypothetical protein